jgi:hypothetical protein
MFSVSPKQRQGRELLPAMDFFTLMSSRDGEPCRGQAPLEPEAAHKGEPDENSPHREYLSFRDCFTLVTVHSILERGIKNLSTT